MKSVERKLNLLEQTISETAARVGELREQNKLLKQQLEQLEHQVADKSRRLAMLEQAEEKFVSVQREVALLRDERHTLKRRSNDFSAKSLLSGRRFSSGSRTL